LRIVPSYNLGVLGPSEGQSILYDWRWYHSVPSLSLWVVLALATVLPRANRTPKVLLIVAPVVIVYGGLLAFLKWVLPSSINPDESFNAFILSVAVGSALLWLVGHLLAGGTWRRTLLGALGIMVGVAILTALSFQFEISAYTLSVMGGLSIPMLAIVTGYALAGRRCRSSYRPGKFGFWLAIGMVLSAVAGGLVFIILQCTFMGAWPNSVVTLLGFAALGGLILGAMAYLISLPFLLVGMRSRMFRERLVSCLRLGPASSARDGTAAGCVQLNPVA